MATSNLIFIFIMDCQVPGYHIFNECCILTFEPLTSNSILWPPLMKRMGVHNYQ